MITVPESYAEMMALPFRHYCDESDIQCLREMLSNNVGVIVRKIGAKNRAKRFPISVNAHKVVCS